ncbi:MAG: WG repeat-containing protein, partial [Bacteroidales bacterium]|nr:WG repeat-containing protein [Bacteroidales bacterium]
MRKLIAFGLALVSCLSVLAAGKNDLKPVRDQLTKKYGYQDASKQWVITPQYDKAGSFTEGIAEVEVAKMKGVIDLTGTYIVPAENLDIVISKSDRVIKIRKNVALPTPNGYTEQFLKLWGFNSWTGAPIFEPAWPDRPDFTSDGIAIVKDAYTKLDGAVTTDGRIVLPYEYLAVKRKSKGFVALGVDFVTREFDKNMNAKVFYNPFGYVKPYRAGLDDIAAIAYGHLGIGSRLHSNTIKRADSVDRGAFGYMAKCSNLPFDWGVKGNRFVRLSVVPDTFGYDRATMYTGNGVKYTVKAVLCEADGTEVETVSQWGYFTASADEGAIYRAEGSQDWLVLYDQNTKPAAAFVATLSHYKMLQPENVVSAFGLSKSELDDLKSFTKMRDRRYNIILKENVGLSTCEPRPELTSQTLALTQSISRNMPFIGHKFTRDFVVTARSIRAAKDSTLSFRPDAGITLSFDDNYSEVGIRNRDKRPIFWGADGESYIMLSLEPVPAEKRASAASKQIGDDQYNSRYGFKPVLALYESDGTFVRTLGEFQKVDYAGKGFAILGDYILSTKALIPVV